MNWIICFFISVSIMIVGLVVAAALIIKRYKSGRVLQPMPALAVGVALSAFFLRGRHRLTSQDLPSVGA